MHGLTAQAIFPIASLGAYIPRIARFACIRREGACVIVSSLVHLAAIFVSFFFVLECRQNIPKRPIKLCKSHRVESPDFEGQYSI